MTRALTGLREVLDKMCPTRLALYLEINNLLSDRQYGFRQNISTVDALRRVWEYIVETKPREFTCILTLDIKRAFNSVRRIDILRLF